MKTVPEDKKLSHKPLIEAIFELKWRIPSNEDDPNYSLFVGRLHNCVRGQFPFHEQLPTAMFPTPAVMNIPQHRFRCKKDGWPLIQIGPGIVTYNDTEGYDWKEFGKQAKKLMKNIFKAYPEPEGLEISSLVLRYLDAFDYNNQNLFTYLEKYLKSKVDFPPQLFENISVHKKPIALQLSAAFQADKPKGTVTISFNSGKRADKPSLIMGTSVQSDSTGVPPMPQGFDDWIEDAHNIVREWFFVLIEGELYKRFK